MCRYFCIGFIDFMLKGKVLTDFTNVFSKYNLKKLWYNFRLFKKMNKVPSIFPDLIDWTFSLNKTD